MGAKEEDEVNVSDNDQEDNLPPYERMRLEHIRRNQEYMAMLGITSLSAEATDATGGHHAKAKSASEAISRPRKRVKASPPQPTRRSARVKGETVEYTREKIDTFGEQLDNLCESAHRRKSRAKAGLTDEEAEQQRQEMVEESRRWLAQSREALLKVRVVRDGGGEAQPSAWRDEAIRRWGDAVGGGDAAVVDWEAYVQSRLSTPPPPSPLDLLQEYYSHDPWRMLVSCILMSRVSSADTKHRCIAAFFELCPTPTALLSKDPDEVQPAVASLGLFPNRYRSLVALSQRFLEMAVFDIGLDPDIKVYGCGPFTVDSYNLFCRNSTAVRPTDQALKSFLNWRKNIPDNAPCFSKKANDSTAVKTEETDGSSSAAAAAAAAAGAPGVKVED